MTLEMVSTQIVTHSHFHVWFFHVWMHAVLNSIKLGQWHENTKNWRYWMVKEVQVCKWPNQAYLFHSIITLTNPIKHFGNLLNICWRIILTSHFFGKNCMNIKMFNFYKNKIHGNRFGVLFTLLLTKISFQIFRKYCWNPLDNFRVWEIPRVGIVVGVKIFNTNNGVWLFLGTQHFYSITHNSQQLLFLCKPVQLKLG